MEEVILWEKCVKFCDEVLGWMWVISLRDLCKVKKEVERDKVRIEKKYVWVLECEYFKVVQYGIGLSIVLFC